MQTNVASNDSLLIVTWPSLKAVLSNAPSPSRASDFLEIKER